MPQVNPAAEPLSAAGGQVGALLLHGYTSTPLSMRPLAERLAADGHAVELPCLPGHGTRWQDLQKTTWRDWAREAGAALDTLAARTRARVVVGQSMGGALALHLAATRGEEVSGLVLVNPSLWSGNRLLPLLPVLKWVLPSVPGLGNDIAAPGADEQPYERNPLRSMHSLTELWRVVRAELADVRAPVLLFNSRNDHVVEPENGDIVLNGVSSTDVERIWLERSYHVATLDHDAAEIERETAAFVKRVSA